MLDAPRSDECTYAGERVTGARLTCARAVALLPWLRAASDLPELHLTTDLGGNEDELAALAVGLREHGLPPALRRLVIDRTRQWDGHGEDELVRDDDGLHLDLADLGTSPLLVEALIALLRREPEVPALSLRLRASGRTDLDPLLVQLIAAGPRPGLRELTIVGRDNSGRDRVRWIYATRLAELLALCPGLQTLSLPMAELELDTLDLPALRSLELHWLGHTPSGPSDTRTWGPGPVPRASGLRLLRHARLPALTRLAIDFQFDWYVAWRRDDIAALCAADLPRLSHLELRDCSQADELCAALASAPFAAQLHALDLTGSEPTLPGVQALLAARPRFTALRELWMFRPSDLPDELWAAFTLAYPVMTPA